MVVKWRTTREYRIWRANVIRRDVSCTVCTRGPTDGITRHAHHLNHSTYFIEQRFDVENGTTLCERCHVHFHNDYKNSTREKCTVHDYNEYKKLFTYFTDVSLISYLKKQLKNMESE